MKKPAILFPTILLAIISVVVVQAQRGPAVPQMRGDGPPPEAKPFSITRTDPALDEIISPNCRKFLIRCGHFAPYSTVLTHAA